MSLRYRGSLISSTAPTIAPGSAQSIWALQEQYQAQASSLWPPSGVGFDEYFENVILLLPGNGTNGAQNNTFLDSSANNFTITRNGNTTQGTFSPFSKADGRWGNYFDGTGDYLTISSSTVFNFGTGNFTIQGWVYMLAYTTGPALFGTTNGATTGYYVNLGGDADTLRVTSNASGTWADNITVSAGNGMRLNEWTHIALVRNGSSLTLYKNGVSVASTSSAASWNFSSPNNAGYIGRVNNGVSTQELNGYISNLRVSNVAESISVPTSPLTAISGTVLLTCQNNRFIDNSTNAFAITRNGDVAVTTFSPFPTLTAYAAGTNGGSSYFDGTGDYLTTPSSSQFAPAGDFTIGIWFYPTSLAAAYSAPLGNFTGNNSTDWLIEVTSAGVLNIYTNGSTVRIASSSGAIKANQWQYIAVCRSGSTITAYLNGTSVGTYSQSGTFGSASKAIGIGARTDTQSPVTGYISSVILLDGTVTTTVPSAPSTAVSGTSLLCNFTNAGIIDTSMSNDLETVGNAQISTTQSKFGGSSIYFDGSGDYLVARYNKLFGLLDNQGDFTLEGWFYRTVVGTGQFLLSTQEYTGTYTGWTLLFNNTNTVGFFCYDSGNNPQSVTSTATVGLNTWAHVAVSRSGGTTRLFVNGVIEATRATAFADTVTQSPLVMGLRPEFGDNVYTGYMQYIRITKGVGRYTSNFTVSSVPFNGFGN